MEKALILDLDNTIYPVPSIGDRLFGPLFDYLKTPEVGLTGDDMEDAKKDIMRIPFQKVAEKYKLSEQVRERCLQILRDLTYDGPIEPFKEYQYVKSLPQDKFLVTTGFKKMQESKVKHLGIDGDFTGIFIVDPETTDKTKKDIFVEIKEKYGYLAEEIIVIGDDPESEIRAARELGMKSLLIDTENMLQPEPGVSKGDSLEALKSILH